jgi:UDP-N-acetylglucosamine 2-epimerase
VGVKTDDIIANCTELLEHSEVLAFMSKKHFPYGRGDAAKRIVRRLAMELGKKR